MKKLAKAFDISAIIIIIIIIISVIPIIIPKTMGYKVYEILSESMSNIYKVGTAVYVEEKDAADINEDDIIAFMIDEESEEIAIHRVVKKDDDNKQFTTKGDMNTSIDQVKIDYDNVVGKAVKGIPYYGAFAGFINSTEGRITLVITFIISLGLWISSFCIQKKGNYYN